MTSLSPLKFYMMQVIKKVKPDFVMVELDRKRYDSMIKGQAAGGRDNPLAFFQQMVQTIANGNIGAVGKLVGVGLSGFYRLLATRGLQPGQEFKVFCFRYAFSYTYA